MRVLITQRVEGIPSRSERRDALDQSWPGTLEALMNEPVIPIPLPNRLADPEAAIRELAPDFLVLTGGNDLAHLDGASNPAPERDNTERQVLDYAMQTELPVLAVCRGMQMLNHHLGGSVQPVSNHVGGAHQIRACSGANGPERLRVNSFHGWMVSSDDLAEDLVAFYCHDDGSVEAAQHLRLPWLGVMWHPERTSPDQDQQMEWLRATLAITVKRSTA
jgi:putative glutamine amidotransferase